MIWTPPPQSVLSIPLSLVMSKLLVWFLFLFLSLAGLKTKRICPFSGSLVLHAAVRTYLSPACVCVRVMCHHVCVCVCVCGVCAVRVQCVCVCGGSLVLHAAVRTYLPPVCV